MNERRLADLRRNAAHADFAATMEGLRKAAEDALAIDYVIGADEQALWGHYYYCEDGTALAFDWSKRHNHRCPQCGRTYTGQPYDGAWLTHAHHSIGSGLKCLGMMVHITGEDRYALRIRSVLLDYARHYEGYAVHGGIPYNGPGKLYDQTLDESHWIVDLVYAYDSVKDRLKDEEKTRIVEGLFRPCARFLIDYKEPQLHNHAVLITAAIATLGFLLEDEDIHRAGRDGEYGLLDQIERGVLPGGFWYEGVFLYHYFAFYPILAYCLFVEGTEWDLRGHSKLRQMFDFPLDYVLTDGTFPSINDLSSKATLHSYAWCYEVAYGWFGEEKYRDYLRIAYGVDDEHKRAFPGAELKPVRRGTLEALLFGRDLRAPAPSSASASVGGAAEPTMAERAKRNASSSGAGLTKLVNGKGWNLLSKHSPFGGEHDHMDRLGISFTAGSAPLIVDPGTTAYGVPVHYGWFKHTYSHNTVNIDGKDQPPADASLVRYAKEPWGAWLETAVDWKRDDYYVKHKIVLPENMCPWDSAAYEGVEIRRVHALTDELLLDVAKVSVPRSCSVGLNYHVSGRLANDDGWEPTETALSVLSQMWLTDKRRKDWQPGEQLRWNVQGGVLRQAGWCSLAAGSFTALTPDNPPLTQRQSLFLVAETSGEALFANVFSYGAADAAEELSLQVTDAAEAFGESGEAMQRGLLLRIKLGERERAFRLRWSGEGAKLERLG